MPKSLPLRYLLLVLCACAVVNNAAADAASLVSKSCIPDEAAKDQVAGTGSASVTAAGLVDAKGKISLRRAADWDDTICVHVVNLAKERDVHKLVLYLNEQALDDPKIGPYVQADGSNDLWYRLVRTQGTKEQWKALLSNPCNPHCTKRDFRVSVGTKEGPPLASTAEALTVELISVRSPGVVLAILAVLGLASLVWSKRLRSYLANLVRETDTTNPPGPFSLGRVQMVVWLFLIIVAYLVIYGLTGYYDALSASALALMGISGGTSLLGVVVDSSSRDQARKSVAGNSMQIAALQALPQPLSPADQQNLSKLQSEQTRLNAIVNPHTSGSFLKDVLSFGNSDDTGVHRFQIAIWTLTLGAIFIIEVSRTLSMPDFAASLLGLTGISSGTYLGFKVATQKPTQQ